MSYAFLANATAVTHFILIFAVLIGILVSIRYKRFRPWESLAMITFIVLWSIYDNCPLTIVEQYYRELAGQVANLTSVGFLPYYADKLFNISIQSKLVQRSTYFTGGIFFASSIEWLSPFINIELFRIRKSLKRLFRRKRLVSRT